MTRPEGNPCLGGCEPFRGVHLARDGILDVEDRRFVGCRRGRCLRSHASPYRWPILRLRAHVRHSHTPDCRPHRGMGPPVGQTEFLWLGTRRDLCVPGEDRTQDRSRHVRE